METESKVDKGFGGWNFASVWNASLERSENRPAKVRDNLWASELGKAPIDLYFKLKGVEPTNPPNPRSLRKFEAGNVFEWIVSLILTRAGILRESQKWSSFQYPNLLKVTGKCDFIAGGKADGNRALNEMGQIGLPDVFIRGAGAVLEHLAREYPEGLDEIPLEIKSISSFMFEALERKGVASKIHRLQLFHYLKSNGYNKGHLVYICRDDLRMMEVLVENNEMNEKEYKEAIENISKYILADKQPSLENPIVFDDDIGKFAKNFNVAYSGYLTKLYGFENQKEFDDSYTPMVGRWNRVLARIKAGKDMTTKNSEVLKEIEKSGFIVEDIIKKFEGELIEEE